MLTAEQKEGIIDKIHKQEELLMQLISQRIGLEFSTSDQLIQLLEIDEGLSRISTELKQMKTEFLSEP